MDICQRPDTHTRFPPKQTTGGESRLTQRNQVPIIPSTPFSSSPATFFSLAMHPAVHVHHPPPGCHKARNFRNLYLCLGPDLWVAVEIVGVQTGRGMTAVVLASCRTLGGRGWPGGEGGEGRVEGVASL